MTRLINQLKELSGGKGRKSSEWLSGAESAIEFLKRSFESSPTILFASMDAVLIHAVLAPLKKLSPADQESLNHDFLQMDDSWGIEHVSGGGKPDKVYLAPPMDRLSKTLKGGEKLVFRRSFPFGSSNTLEVSQKLVHALNLQFIEERSAYCRLDADGDIEEVIKIHEENVGDWYDRITIVTILAADFAKYMRLASMGIVVFFDFTRTQRGAFSGWSNDRDIDFKAPDLFYHGGVMEGHGSYVNGRMIVRPRITYNQILAAHVKERSPIQQHATFKAISLRTGERIEVSCAEECLSNYFQPDSDLPHELSPAFFKAEVLHKYKSDPEKYTLEDRSIHCRGTWSLKTFDVNAEGQVHTYLCYLRMLPYREQIYWQSFNEWPKGSLSERAITTDFKGDFFYGSDPLNALRQTIVRLDEQRPSWWQPRLEELRKSVHIPATSAPAEWGDEILALDHLVNEGFKLKELRAVAKKLGCSVESEWRVFKLLEESLKRLNVEENDAAAAIAGLRKIRDLRNVLKGHAAPEKRRQFERDAIRSFGTFRAHFENLADNANTSLELIADTLMS